MNVLITGGSGFIGTQLVNELLARGHDVTVLDRSRPARAEAAYIQCDLLHDELLPEWFKDQDIIVHLTGVNIFKHWSNSYKQLMYDSRVLTAQKIAGLLNELGNPKQRVVSASAIGIYGDSAKPVDESSKAGNDFLARLCVDWEKAWEPLGEQRQTTMIRTGIVIGKGGMIGTLAPIFRLGLGANMGSGKQHMSWIAMEDLIKIYVTAIENSTYSGAINAVATKPVSFDEMTHTLARVLHRPRIFRIPSLVLKLVLRERAGTLLMNQEVLPQMLRELGYTYECDHLETAITKAVK